MTDKEIYVKIVENNVLGSENALRFLYEDNYQMVEKFILNHGGNSEDAKDVFQESIISFYSNVKNNKYTLDSKVSTYLYAVSRNNWFKKIRNSKKEINYRAEDLPHQIVESNIYHELIYTEDQKIIANLLRTTGEKCRKILQLYYFERLKLKSIAKILGYGSEQAAKNKKSLCMKKIKEVVSNNEFYKKQFR